MEVITRFSAPYLHIESLDIENLKVADIDPIEKALAQDLKTKLYSASN